MNCITRFHGPFSDIHGAGEWPWHLQRHVPALALLRKTPHPAQRHQALPSDVFVVTVYLDDNFQCGTVDEEPNLEVVVSALRTGPAEFVSNGGGALALALLTPLGLLQGLRAPLEGLTDRRIPLAWFCGWHEQRRLRDALLQSATPQQRLARFCAWLETRMLDTAPLSGPARRVAQAAMTLYESAGEAPPAEALADSLSIGRRQLERDFRRWIGVSPGTYARLVRFQRSADAVIAGRDLIQVAVDHGYADQPHMTRAFRELARATPGEIAVWGRHGAAPMRAALAGRMLMLQTPAQRSEPLEEPAQLMAA